jgi:hypothetical protein
MKMFEAYHAHDFRRRASQVVPLKPASPSPLAAARGRLQVAANARCSMNNFNTSQSFGNFVLSSSFGLLMDFLKSAVASAISKGPPFPYTFGDRVDVDTSIWNLFNGTKRV